MSEPLTAEQAAEELGYTLNHVYKLLRAGKIQARRFGQAYLIDRQEVERVKALQSAKGRLPRVPKQQKD